MRRATLALALAAALGGAGGASLTGEPSRGSQTARAVVTGPPYAVGETQVTFVDPSRTVSYPGNRRDHASW